MPLQCLFNGCFTILLEAPFPTANNDILSLQKQRSCRQTLCQRSLEPQFAASQVP